MIQLYGRRNSINVQKVSWALCELNLEFKWHDEHGKFGKVNVENYEKIYNKNEGYLSESFFMIIRKHANVFRSFIDDNKDYDIDFFGFKTLERAYLMKKDNKICERIQHLWLRVAIQIHGEHLEKVKETYQGLSNKYFIHATPTLFNSGTKRPQLSSCYLLSLIHI